MRVRRLSCGLFFCSAVLLSGCAVKPVVKTQPLSQPKKTVTPVQVGNQPSSLVPVARYSSVSDQPSDAEINPLSAMAQYTFNPRIQSVGKAVHQVLQGTGYQLVSSKALPHAVRALFRKPLPVTQRHLGPARVSDLLEVLVGKPVFSLVIDPVHRLVAFEVKPMFRQIAGEH